MPLDFLFGENEEKERGKTTVYNGEIMRRKHTSYC